MINLGKCTGSCNELFPKKCVPKETKNINIKTFKMITNKNEAKTMAKRISCDCKCKFNSTNGLIKHVNVNVKIIISAKKVGILAHVFVRIANV